MRTLTTGASITLAQKSLDALWLRQQAISDNIANQDTPGYKSKSVVFENLLERALEGSEKVNTERTIGALEPKVEQENRISMSENENGVDTDAENIALVRTQLQYQAMAQAASAEFSRIGYVVNGGR